MTRLSGYQPHYFPRLHYVQRALSSDIFEISDYLQFVKKHQFRGPDGTSYRGKSYQAHASIKLADGLHHLVVPAKDGLQAINKTPIVYSPNWVQKHLETIKVAYRGASEFDKVFPEVEALLSEHYSSLGELTIRTVVWSILRMVTDEPIIDLTIETLTKNLSLVKHPFRLRTVLLASQMGVPHTPGDPTAWIIELCKKVNADEYITGGSAMSAYMDPSRFEREGIAIAQQDWTCPVYPQRYPRIGFIPNLSALDFIMNVSLYARQEIVK